MVLLEPTSGAIKVDNVAGRDICLRIAGVSLTGPGDSLDRCHFQQFTETSNCLVLPASRSLTFIPKHEGCLTRSTEFRVGDFEHDDIAWWTDSALRDLEISTANLRQNLEDFIHYRQTSDDQLSKDIARLEAMVPDAGRAERWREDLDFWRRLRN